MSSTAKFDGIKELAKLTASTTNEETASFYNKWAKEYEKDCITLKYIGHETFVDIFDQEMKKLFKEDRFNKTLLDIGAGTGITGEHLKHVGYKNVDAVDISNDMLDVARGKGVYQKLVCAALCDKKIDEIETGHYDATISTGAIHIGHIKPDAFDEMLRHVKPGGIIFMVIEESLVKEKQGYKEKLDEMAASKKWELLRTDHMEYCIIPGTDILEKAYLFTYKVLANK